MKAITTYIIRNARTGKMVDCYEGSDGQKHAADRVAEHNQHSPNDAWKLVEESI